MSKKTATAMIILAAGASRRMGRAKQLLRWQGQTMLQRAVAAGREAGFTPIVVVTGARREAVVQTVERDGVLLAHNANWEKGMGGSVVVGLRKLLENAPHTAAVALALTDQPYVDAALLRSMNDRLLPCDALGIAAYYRGTLGVPVIFRRPLFPELLELNGKKGAKPVLLRHRANLLAFPFPQGAVDLDTPEDWERLRSKG